MDFWELYTISTALAVIFAVFITYEIDGTFGVLLAMIMGAITPILNMLMGFCLIFMFITRFTFFVSLLNTKVFFRNKK